MTDRIADKDIVETNENGQRVVLVAKGQPIPEGVSVPKAKTTSKARSKTEDKAKRGPKNA